MKSVIVIIAIFVCSTSGWGQRPIELQLGDGEREFPMLLSPVFDDSAEHLISILGRKIRVVATSDGSLVREYLLPVRERTYGVANNSSSLYQVGQISLAFGGNSLVVIADDRCLDEHANPEPIFLIDINQLVRGENVTPISIRYPKKGTFQPHRFVCSLGDDRLVFVTRNVHQRDQSVRRAEASLRRQSCHGRTCFVDC
jgi:hypothetical protein